MGQLRDSEVDLYVAWLTETLLLIGAEVPRDFGKMFLLHLRRMGTAAGENREDLGSLLLSECLKAKAEEKPLTGREVTLALDRVRHRIVRAAETRKRSVFRLRDRSPPTTGQMIDKTPKLDQLDSLRLILTELTTEELHIVDLLSQEVELSKIAASLGIPFDALRKKVSRFRSKMRDRYPDEFSS